ncbi:hypothetical protein V2O64_16755 [Verrucomicrobiaceae bacterium 227]
MNHHPKSEWLEKRAKDYRRLHEEQRQLCHEKYHAPLVELDEPYLRGYERFFVLSKAALRRKDAEKLSYVLQFFQHHEYCRKGWFRNIHPPGKRWAKGEVGKHFLRRPQLNDLIKASLPRSLYPYIKARFLDLENGLPPVRLLKKHQQFERVTFRHSNLLRTHTRVRLVTHLPLHDPALEARLDQLDTILWNGANRGAVNKALHRRHWKGCQPSPRVRAKLEDFRQQLEEANSDPTIKSAVSLRFFSALSA